MAETELTQQVGARMRRAAEAKRLNQTEVAELVDRQPGTISKWFSGQQKPSLEDMELYAQAVGVSTAWLWTGQETLTPELILGSMANCLHAIARGSEPSAAFDAITNEPTLMLPQDRRSIDAIATEIRNVINSRLPGWETLSEGEQVREIRRLLAPHL